MSTQNRIVLVTGGAGFIGSHLVPKIIANGFKVRILDSLSAQIHGALPQGVEWLNQKGIEFLRGSVTDVEDLKKAVVGVTDIVHLAAETGTGQSMYQIARYNEVNTQGTALLLDVIAGMEKRTVERILLASSRSVYGEGSYSCKTCEGAKVTPKSRNAEALEKSQWDPRCEKCGGDLKLIASGEEDTILPVSIYAATKFTQEELIRIACDSLKIGYVNYRLQNVYGEGQSLKNPYTGILSIFSTKIRMGKELPLFEDGLESRDFVHVDDVANAFLHGLLVKKIPNQVINVGSGVATSIHDVAVLLSEAFGVTPNVRVTGQFRLGDIRHNYASMERLKNLLDVSPKVSLKEGLSRFAKWVQTQPLPEDMVDKANQELRARNLMK